MADKKKPNFADSLKGAARAVSPATPSEDEVVQIDVGGEVVTVPRGKGANRLDDAAWERVKARALPTESKDMKSKPLGWSDLMGLGQNLDGVADSVVSKEQKELLKKTDEWTRAEYLRQRFKARGYEVPPNSADDERKSYKDGKKADTVDVGVQKPDQGTPDEWKPMPEQKTGTPTTQTEDDAMVGSAGVTGSTPWARAASAVQQMATGQTMGTTPEEIAASQKWQQEHQSAKMGAPREATDLVDAVKRGVGEVGAVVDRTTADAKKTLSESKLGIEAPNLAANIAPNLGVDPRYIQPVADLNAGLQGAAKSLVAPFVESGAVNIDGNTQHGAGQRFLDAFGNEVVSGVTNPMGLLKNIGTGIRNITGGGAPQTEQQAIEAALAKSQPVAAPAPAQNPTAGVTGTGGGSMSMSGRVPGKNGGTSAPKMSDAETMLMQGYETQKNADALLADIESRKLQSKADLIRQQQDEAAKLAARQAAMETARAERMKRGEAGLATLQARLADLEGQSPDPNRYWNNKDAGQKAAAVVAGALFGFTGQGMPWLQRLDGLVEADIQQQAAELQRKSGLVGKQIDVQNNMVALARQQGLDEAESISAARAMMLQNYALRFEQMAATTGSEAAKANALANAGILRQKVAAELGDMRIKTSKAANDAALTAAQIAHLNAQTFALGTKAAGGGKGAEGDRKLPPGTREEVAKIDKGLEALQQAREALAGGNRFTDQIANNLRSVLSAIGLQTEGMFFTPDTTGRTAVAESAQETALKAVMGEALQEKDIERNRPRFARPGLNAGNTKWIDAQEEILRAKRNALTRSKSEDDLIEMPSTLAPNYAVPR